MAQLSSFTLQKRRIHPQPAPGNVKSNPENHEIQREAIAKLAFEKFIARGGQHGFDQEDWLAAERELASQIQESKRFQSH